MIIPIWIVVWSGVIIYNNYLYNTLDFKYLSLSLLSILALLYVLSSQHQCFYMRSNHHSSHRTSLQ
jgi:hypothetical protein